MVPEAFEASAHALALHAPRARRGCPSRSGASARSAASAYALMRGFFQGKQRSRRAMRAPAQSAPALGDHVLEGAGGSQAQRSANSGLEEFGAAVSAVRRREKHPPCLAGAETRIQKAVT